MRWVPLIVLVALGIVVVLIAQQSLRTYEQLQTPLPLHPVINTTTAATQANAVATPLAGPRVEQVSYNCKLDPNDGMLHATVLLKNVGKSKAFNVQIYVRPFKGTSAGRNDNGVPVGPEVTDSDPIATMGQWVSFPDLDAGQTATQTVQFVQQPTIPPGDNSNPNITYDAGSGSGPSPAPTP